MLYDTLVHLDLMPYRELSTPEDVKAALHGVDRLLIDATERAYHRSTEHAKQREHYSGKKNSIRGRSYGFGDWAKTNKASKRPLTQASLRCKRWLKPSSLQRIPTPLNRC